MSSSWSWEWLAGGGTIPLYELNTPAHFANWDEELGSHPGGSPPGHCIALSPYSKTVNATRYGKWYAEECDTRALLYAVCQGIAPPPPSMPPALFPSSRRLRHRHRSTAFPSSIWILSLRSLAHRISIGRAQTNSAARAAMATSRRLRPRLTMTRSSRSWTGCPAVQVTRGLAVHASTMCRCRRPRGAGRVAAAPFRASSHPPHANGFANWDAALGEPKTNNAAWTQAQQGASATGSPVAVPPSTPLLDPLSSAAANGLRPTAHSAYCDMPSARK